MVNSCQTKVRVNVSLVATTATKITRCYCSPVYPIRCFRFFVCVSVVQSRNWTFNQQRRLMYQRQSQEEHRQQEARRVNRERQLQACLREEESSERKRYLRQVQEELKERQIESTLLKVRFLLPRLSLPSCYFLFFFFLKKVLLSLTQTICPSTFANPTHELK